MSTDIIPFQKQEFGALALLPDQVKAWKIKADDLAGKSERFKELVAQLNLQALTIEELDSFDKRLNNSMIAVGGAFTAIELERKAATAILDEVKSYSMLPEKTLKDYPDVFKGYRNLIAKEKARRIREAEEIKAKAVAKANEAVKIKYDISGTILSNANRLIASTIESMNKKFNEQTIESIDEYAVKLGKYIPQLSTNQWAELQKNGNATYFNHTPDEVTGIYKDVATGLHDSVADDINNAILNEMRRLLEIVPSRKKELEEIAAGNAETARISAERIEQEAAERITKAEQEAKDQSEALAANVSVEQLDNSFEAEAAIPSITQAKGTSTKFKYEITHHAGWIALLQAFLKHDLLQMDMNELEKKLGFMKKAAEARLNKTGECLEAKGLEKVEDFLTRVNKAV